MTDLTTDERDRAVDRHLLLWREELATITIAVQLHRDILKSPREQVKGLEDQAEKAAQAVAWLAGQKKAD